MESPFFSWEQNKKYYLLSHKRLTALHKRLTALHKKLTTHYKKLKAHYIKNKDCFHRFTRKLSFFDK